MTQQTVNGYEGIYSMDALKADIKAYKKSRDSLEYILYEPFSEWLSLNDIIEGVHEGVRMYPDATFIRANETHATYIVNGTSPRTLEENGHVSITHTRERIVRFPLDFIENSAPYEEAARTALAEREAKAKAEANATLEARLALIESERAEIVKLLNL